MGICYYCDHDITVSDIFMQRRDTIILDGIVIGRAHKDCYALSKKYGKDYFIKELYLQKNEYFSEYDLTRILSHLDDTKSINVKRLADDLDLNLDEVKMFWEFLVIKERIRETPNAPTLPKST